jgi:hypothetical protein
MYSYIHIYIPDVCLLHISVSRLLRVHGLARKRKRKRKMGRERAYRLATCAVHIIYIYIYIYIYAVQAMCGG